MKNLTFLIVFIFIPLNFAQHAHDLTQIRYQGDYVIISENKLGEFFRNYAPKDKKTFTKSFEEVTLDGYVTDALTLEPLDGIDVSVKIYQTGGEFELYGPVKTDINGYYIIEHVVLGLENNEEIKNIGQLEYFGGQVRITTNTYKKIKLTTYDILGQEINTLFDKEILGTETIPLELLVNQPTITRIEIDGNVYTAIHIKQNNIYSVRSGKNVEQMTEKSIERSGKPVATGGIIDLIDSTRSHHDYIGGGTGEFTSNTPRFNMALLPRMNLDSAFVDPNYTVIDTIKTFRDIIWDLGNIQGEWDNRDTAPTLYNWQLCIDTTNCPTEWKEPIRDAIQYWRDTMAVYLGMESDSLIIETDHYTDPFSGQNFSPINISYVNEIPNNWDSWRTVYFDAENYVSVGADFFLNTSTGMQPIDVFKEINRNLEEYIIGTGPPYNRRPPGMLLDHRNRGEPRTPQKNDKELTKIMQNIQKINKHTYFNKIFP
jgi:hypothetical protein